MAQLYATTNQEENSVKKFFQTLGLQQMETDETPLNALNLTTSSSRKRRRSESSDTNELNLKSCKNPAFTTLMQNRLAPHLAFPFTNSSKYYLLIYLLKTFF